MIHSLLFGVPEGICNDCTELLNTGYVNARQTITFSDTPTEAAMTG